jgi:type IV pilus assembly protein PilO
MSIIDDKIKKLTPKQQTLLLFFMPALILGAFMYFIYLPGSKTISGLETTVLKNQSEISKSQIMQSKLKLLKAENERLQQELKLATQRLPSAQEVDGVPDTISGEAKASGLSVKSVKAGDQKTGPGGLYVQTPINVEVNGGYHDLGNFMEKLDKMTMMMTVSELNISSGTVGGIKMNLPIKFTVLAYTAGGGK